MGAKRLFDLVAALVGLLVTSPAIGLAAAGILASDGRPVVFRQERVGRDGQSFEVRKFRTMRVCAASAGFDAGDDSRVTRIGRWLRASKIDELPQLVNVIRGEMSIVGPRPEVSGWVYQYPERFATVLTVRPGITDPASVVFRHEERLLARADDPVALYRDVILPRKLDLYEEYVRNHSIRGDLAIIIRTFRTLVSRES